MNKKISFIVFVVLVATTFLFHPFKLEVQENLPSENPADIRNACGETTIGQVVKLPKRNFSLISFFVPENINIDTETPVELHIRKSAEDSLDIATVKGKLKDFLDGNLIKFDFKRVNNRDNTFYVFVSAPKLTGKNPLPIHYQKASEIYPEGEMYIKNKPQKGDLAFVTSVSPTLSNSIFLAAKAHPIIFLGIIFILTAIVSSPYLRHPENPGGKSAKDNKANIKESRILVAVLVVIVFVVFLPILKFYFYQDDFVILERARRLISENPLLLLTNRGFLEVNKNHTEVAFYRPVANSVIPAIQYILFKNHALPYYIFALAIHAINTATVFFIARKLFSPKISFLAALFWAIHQPQWKTVAWLSSLQEITGAMFILLTILMALNFWQNKQKKYLFFSLLFFSLAILSKENSFLLLFLLPVFLFISSNAKLGKKTIKNIAAFLIPFLFIAGIVLILHDLALSDPWLPPSVKDPSYNISFTPKVLLGNLLFHLSCIFPNWIFSTHDSWQIQTTRYLDEASLLKGWQTMPPFFLLFAIGLTILFIFIAFILSDKNNRKKFILGIFVFFVALTPFLILKNERSERWLYLPLFGTALIFGSFLSAVKSTVFKKIRLGTPSLFFTSAIMLIFTFCMLKVSDPLKTARNHSDFSRTTLLNLLKKEPNIKPGSKVILNNVDPYERGNLGHAAIPWIYRDKTIVTEYQNIPDAEDVWTQNE